MSSSSSVQFSYNGVNTGRSILLLNIKINVKLKQKKAIVARNQNSIRWQDGEKNLGLFSNK